MQRMQNPFARNDSQVEYYSWRTARNHMFSPLHVELKKKHLLALLYKYTAYNREKSLFIFIAQRERGFRNAVNADL